MRAFGNGWRVFRVAAVILPALVMALSGLPAQAADKAFALNLKTCTLNGIAFRDVLFAHSKNKARIHSGLAATNTRLSALYGKAKQGAHRSFLYKIHPLIWRNGLHLTAMESAGFSPALQVSMSNITGSFTPQLSPATTVAVLRKRYAGKRVLDNTVKKSPHVLPTFEVLELCPGFDVTFAFDPSTRKLASLTIVRDDIRKMQQGRFPGLWPGQ